MTHLTIAWVDMRPNLAVATVILIVGACGVVLLSRRKVGKGNKAHWWLPLAALVAGPVIAFASWAAEVFVFHPDMYPAAFQGDAMATLSGTMIIGAFVGVVAAVAFAVALNARRGSNDSGGASPRHQDEDDTSV